MGCLVPQRPLRWGVRNGTDRAAEASRVPMCPCGRGCDGFVYCCEAQAGWVPRLCSLSICVGFWWVTCSRSKYSLYKAQPATATELGPGTLSLQEECYKFDACAPHQCNRPQVIEMFHFLQPVIKAHACPPWQRETSAGGPQQVPGQHVIHSKPVFQNKPTYKRPVEGHRPAFPALGRWNLGYIQRLGLKNK